MGLFYCGLRKPTLFACGKCYCLGGINEFIFSMQLCTEHINVFLSCMWKPRRRESPTHLLMAVPGFTVCALSTAPHTLALSSLKEPQEKMDTSGMQKGTGTLTVTHARTNTLTQPSPHRCIHSTIFSLSTMLLV